MRDRVIVCCTPSGADEAWFVQELADPDIRWLFYGDRARYFWQHWFQRPNLNTPIAGLRAALAAKLNGAILLISVDPRLSLWLSFFCRVFGVNVEHFVFSFNFAELPRGWKQKFFSYAFERIDSIRVHSHMEVELYSRHFRIPRDRIRVGLWCMNTPIVNPDQPLFAGPYACAIGGNARDYHTLLESSRQTPDIPMVWVVRPENVVGISVPTHVKVVCNVPYGEAMNYLQHSQFMVLPLKGAEVPCGHVTIVSAMLLSKAVIATNSVGISDYIQDGLTGILCPPADPNRMAKAMRALWADPSRCELLGRNGLEFAETFCTERRLREEMTVFLREHGLVRQNLTETNPVATF